MVNSRKASDATLIPQCHSCSCPIDTEGIACNFCSKSFHLKKECSNITASVGKALLSSDNLTYSCNDCKGINIRDLLNRFSSMEKELKSLRDQLNTKSAFDVGSIVCQALKENQEQMEKRNNMMIFGIKESADSGRQSADDDGEDESEVLESVFNHLGISKTDIISATRVGKKGRNPRPMRVKLNSLDLKLKCFRKARDLKKSNMADLRKVSIRNDLTFLQLAADRKLVQEFKHRKEKGENVVLRRGKIIEIQDDGY